ncbi:MetQ/NlpA family ABC transporter substrate-binding protein [Lactobacillus sp.]|uniref:MetQ/NlpA family ABC transporter substrate-binding protein n=1 Tax=Lactobacillus sp. TaxID=1591 RepID=UPI00198CBC0B|nr:MetQ/NlpA family ABC transporter substrate-binding protein [Lactobacillus sp.]MBD5429233.1 MetQ/NlpA family ABC transporter substrate-binding protein [Lactobacillus sp.]
MRKKRIRNRIIWSVITVFILITGWFSFGPQPKVDKTKVVTVGIVGAAKGEKAIWNSVAKTMKEKYGVTLKIKSFDGYDLPDKALKSGDVDLNSFQHYAYLKEWNKANHGGIVAIGDTYIAPIRLYSKKYKSITDLPDGATIAIPSDATNESRALFVLKNAGLIKLRKGKTLVSIADITSNPHHYHIKEVASEQTSRVISSVDAAVVNNDFSGPAGLGNKETIFVEPLNKDSKQWVNIICARTKDKNNKVYQEVVKAYQSKTTKQLYKKYYGNKQIAAWDSKL